MKAQSPSLTFRRILLVPCVHVWSRLCHFWSLMLSSTETFSSTGTRRGYFSSPRNLKWHPQCVLYSLLMLVAVFFVLGRWTIGRITIGKFWFNFFTWEFLDFNQFSQCLKITPKVTFDFFFQIWRFLPIPFLLKLLCFTASFLFSKTRSKCKLNFARNVEWDFFCDFQTLCS